MPAMEDTAIRILRHAATEALARAQNLGRIPAPVATEPQAAPMPENSFAGIIPILKRLLVISTIVSILLLSSTAEYGLFYLLTMPGYKATAHLFFDYSGLVKHPLHPAPGHNETYSTHDSLDENLSDPWAFADLFAKHSQWEPFQQECVPKLLTEYQLLKAGHAYYMEVTLDLPESDINRESGIFGVLVELQSSNGTKLAKSMRSARIPHETKWISTVRKGLMLVPLLIGATHESKRVMVPSFRHFVESSEAPLRYVTVRLIRDKSVSHGMKPLEITTADIRLGRELSDLQLFLKEWFFTCYVIGTCFFFVLQLIALFVVRFKLEEQRRKREIEEEASLNLELHGSGNHFEPPDNQIDPPEDQEWDAANEVPLDNNTMNEGGTHSDNSNTGGAQFEEDIYVDRMNEEDSDMRSPTPPLQQENTPTS